MTAKEFFKSTSFKCIVTLLCILLVCGIFLTVAYGFLEVTDEERFQRAINKIYGEEISVTALEYGDDDAKFATATVLDAYIDENGNYLIKAKGTGGYSGGTVTCWVLVNVENGEVTKVSKVVIDTYVSQTLMSSINFLGKYAEVEYTEGYEYTTDDGFTVTGATMSSSAINNAVNAAVSFVRMTYLGATDPYAMFEYYDFINFDETVWSVEDGTISYHIVTKGNSPARSFTIDIAVGSDKKISTYNIIVNGSTSDEYKNKVPESVLDGTAFVGKTLEELEVILDDNSFIATGATCSGTLCYQAALFAVANYDYCLVNIPEEKPEELPEEGAIDISEFDYLEFIDVKNTSVELDGTTAVYTIVTATSDWTDAFTVTVKVGENGVITDYEIVTNGSTFGLEEEMAPAILDGTMFKDKSLSELLAILGDDTVAFPGEDEGTEISTGATYSNHLCLYAAVFAAANYDNCIAQGGN